jgi:hypothetical protein
MDRKMLVRRGSKADGRFGWKADIDAPLFAGGLADSQLLL